MLDLFITHWTEDWETIVKPGFDMLGCQRLVDWNEVRIVLVHDGTKAYPEEYFAKYPFAVEQVELPHGGIAKARNWCIDHSKAEWIRWHDCDDTFSGAYSLYGFLDGLHSAKNYDLLWFKIYAEMDGKLHVKDERDPVVVHNKIFRRQMLLDHKLRFPEFLTWCEDSAFLAVMEMEIDHQRIGKMNCPIIPYIWYCRQGSLCNRPEIRFENLKSFFERHKYVAEEFRKRGLYDQCNTMIARIMVDSYITLCRANLPEGSDREAHERNVWEYFRKNRKYFMRCRTEMFDLVMNACNREAPAECGIVLKEEVLNWLRKLENKYEGSAA